MEIFRAVNFECKYNIKFGIQIFEGNYGQVNFNNLNNLGRFIYLINFY